MIHRTTVVNAVDLAPADVLPDAAKAGKGLGVLYVVSGGCAIVGAIAVLPVTRVR